MEIIATLLLCGWLLDTSPTGNVGHSWSYGDGGVHLYQTYEKYYYGSDFPKPKRKWVWK